MDLLAILTMGGMAIGSFILGLCVVNLQKRVESLERKLGTRVTHDEAAKKA